MLGFFRYRVEGPCLRTACTNAIRKPNHPVLTPQRYLLTQRQYVTLFLIFVSLIIIEKITLNDKDSTREVLVLYMLYETM